VRRTIVRRSDFEMQRNAEIEIFAEPPKETARAPGPCGLPCASRSRRALWNSLTLKQPQGLFRRLLRCSARDDGTSNPGCITRWIYGCCLRKRPHLRG
jgi:hypothetical protein